VKSANYEAPPYVIFSVLITPFLTPNILIGVFFSQTSPVCVVYLKRETKFHARIKQ